MIHQERKPGILIHFRRGILAVIFLLSAFILLVFLQSCGMTGNRSTMMTMTGGPTSFAFVTNSGSGTVSAFAVSSTGSLSGISGSPFPAGPGAEFMAFDKIHKFLFVANQTANTTSVFSVNMGTGMLTPVSGSPFSTGAAPLGVAVDPAGRFLFVANQNDHSVSVFSINAASGALSGVPGSPFSGVTSPFGVAVNPSGTLLFVSNFNGNTGTGNTVSTFSLDL